MGRKSDYASDYAGFLTMSDYAPITPITPNHENPHFSRVSAITQAITPSIRPSDYATPPLLRGGLRNRYRSEQQSNPRHIFTERTTAP